MLGVYLITSKFLAILCNLKSALKQKISSSNGWECKKMSGVKSLQVFINLNLAPGMNEAKEYDTIEDFHQRDDKKYKQKI